MAIAVLAISTLSAMPAWERGTARANALCMSDGELRAFLHNVTLRSFGMGLGICAENYRELRRSNEQLLKLLEKNHGKFFSDTDVAAKRPFQRAYGPRAEIEYERAEDAANASGKTQYEAYSLAQCQTHRSGVEVIFGGSQSVNGERVAATLDKFMATDWEKERAKLARCR